MRNYNVLKLTSFIKRNRTKVSEKTIEIVESIEKSYKQQIPVTKEQYKLLVNMSHSVYVELNYSDFFKHIENHLN